MLARQLAFPKNRRLTRPAEFEHVKKNGRVHRGRLLVISVVLVNDVGPFRAGFVTSRELGSAVVRNRVRRRLREMVRQRDRELAPATWIGTIGRGGAAHASAERLGLGG